MFVDQVKISLKAGDGGNGITAYRREKYVPFGGPAGGDGVCLYNTRLMPTDSSSSTVKSTSLYSSNLSAIAYNN